MSRLFYHVMQDNVGNLLFNVSGTMRLAGTGTLATIYGDAALTAILPNPMTNHLSYGSFKCYLGPGTYDFYMAKSGYTFETLTGLAGGGSLANQDANAVAITGGSANLTTLQVFGASALTDVVVTSKLQVGPGAVTSWGGRQFISYARASQPALSIRPDSDTGGTGTVIFLNSADTPVGTITTTGAATAYNTTSDARLKTDVQPLAGALDVVRALNPVSFLWQADGTPGRGLLANEVQEVLAEGVVTGAADAVDQEGQIQPQMIDYSKLVPYLIGAVKELTQQVEMLQVQLAAAGV